MDLQNGTSRLFVENENMESDMVNIGTTKKAMNGKRRIEMDRPWVGDTHKYVGGEQVFLQHKFFWL